MMNSFILVAMTASMGVALGGFICMQSRLDDCHALVSSHVKRPICTGHSGLTSCINKGAKDCGVESEPIVKELINTITDTCSEGTEMNKLFQEHKSCVFGYKMPDYSKCKVDYRDEIGQLGVGTETTDISIKVLKVYCKYYDAINQCMAHTLNRICGPEADVFRRRFYDPYIKLRKQACISIENGTGDIFAVRNTALANESQNEGESKYLLTTASAAQASDSQNVDGSTYLFTSTITDLGYDSQNEDGSKYLLTTASAAQASDSQNVDGSTYPLTSTITALGKGSKNEDRSNEILISAATSSDSQNLLHILAQILLLKCFSNIYT